ncbi:hypothetical protein E3G49_001424 [Mycobacteroides abscessus]|nr:hypothetical protein [Mycobacteroides abscessus]
MTADGTVEAWQLLLQGATAKTNEMLMYYLGEDRAVAEEVERNLAAAEPGEFVPVKVRFTNLLDETTLYVQPHIWGVWAVIQKVMTTSEVYAGQAPR